MPPVLCYLRLACYRSMVQTSCALWLGALSIDLPLVRNGAHSHPSHFTLIFRGTRGLLCALVRAAYPLCRRFFLLNSADESVASGRSACGVAGRSSARVPMGCLHAAPRTKAERSLHTEARCSAALHAADGRTKYGAFGMHHGMAQSVKESGL